MNLLILTRALVAAIYLGLIFKNYPLLGHDFSALYPAILELKTAFWDHGVLNPEFSPFRCWGLPLFANPNSLSLSLFHFMGLLLPPLGAILGTGLFYVALGYWAVRRIALHRALSSTHAEALAVLWSLQGFLLAHWIVGHVNFMQIAALPAIFLFLKRSTQSNPLGPSALRQKRTWSVGALCVLYFAHLFYSSGYYLYLTGAISLALALLIDRWAAPPLTNPVKPNPLRPWLELSALLAMGAVLGLPKILAVRDFLALYPREMVWSQVSIPKSLLFSWMQFWIPAPVDYRSWMGWWYGNWESTLWLPIGWILLLAHPKIRKNLLLQALGISGIAALFVSGAIAPGLQHLPFLKSLHVNPRWFVIFTFPMLLLAIQALSSRESAVRANLNPLSRPWLIALLLGALSIPLTRPQSSFIHYPAGAGLTLEQDRALYCYEPIFGYQLENLPHTVSKDFAAQDTSSHWVDPRCYLASQNCEPGKRLGATPQDLETIKALQAYRLLKSR